MRIKYDPSTQMVWLYHGYVAVARMTLIEYQETFGTAAALEVIKLRRR